MVSTLLGRQLAPFRASMAVLRDSDAVPQEIHRLIPIVEKPLVLVACRSIRDGTLGCDSARVCRGQSGVFVCIQLVP
jgi:hypothetical protein